MITQLQALAGDSFQTEFFLATIHIVRLHAQGLPQARKIALAWAQQLEAEYRMECQYQKGKARDALQFRGTGVSGTLHITQRQFELDATLGLFLGVFKGKIEAAIVEKLDAHLALATGLACNAPR